MAPTTVVSAPGKVLVAGGYLVLDPAYSGVVVSTSSRFYTVVQDSETTDGQDGSVRIRVRSPQFVNAIWTYEVVPGESGVKVEPVSDNLSKNKFVHLALERTLTLASQLRGSKALQERLSHDLAITIVGDNDFYSQRAQLTSRNLPPTLASLTSLPAFLHTAVPISDVHKTGLGSSAALITSLVSALLLHLNVIPSDSFAANQGGSESASEGRKLAHNLAQYVHCLAQGKVGSGFDVSAAVFGSQLYTKFEPEVLKPLMSDQVAPETLPKALEPSNPAWNFKALPFHLPPNIRLMLADVDAGSDTPSLVGKVLKWRQENNEKAKLLWDTIDSLNQNLSKILLSLSESAVQHPKEYQKMIKYLSTLQSVQWLSHPALSAEEQTIVEAFAQVRQTAQSIRDNMREMGNLSGVPIEPPEQTSLLDACVSVAGVIGGGVPGAGGYDAIWLLVFDPIECPQEELPSTRIQVVWQSWKGLDVSPLLASESKEKGARVEELNAIPGLKEVVAQ
ncbi:hypothetical protein QCA50_009582 [Cerrena zonata]|uniref:Phosphomevalonate kinase n=1 Tax=Cerrena zonata TaxID=2478898 RepID=A0AAW0G3Z3_9APHY